MKANKIMAHLENYFPLYLQQPWDKCGIQIGDQNQDVQKVMIALNADLQSLNHAINCGCQMLITHHPFLLEEIKNLDFTNHHGRFVQLAIENHIVVYSLHTCLDQGQNGISMNDWLIEKLGVLDINSYDQYQIGKKAILKQPMNGLQFVKFVQKKFQLSHLKYSANTDKMINKIAICGGSGADDIEKLTGQVDCFITGDTKHRHAKYAIDHDILLIDVGHHLEVMIEEKLPELLEPLKIEVIINHSQDYFEYQ